MGADPDICLARVHWSADGDTLYVERENRDQTRLDMLVVDPEPGTSRVLFSEKSGPKSWINRSNSFPAMADGSLLWWSERSGHGQPYHYVEGNFVALARGSGERDGRVGA